MAVGGTIKYKIVFLISKQKIKSEYLLLMNPGSTKHFYQLKI